MIRSLTLCFAMLAAFAAPRTSSQAQEIRDFLRAGEFAPALQAANQLPAGPQRDQWLQQVAQEQARVGARQAGLGTVRGMGGDMLRNQAFNQIGGQPVGAAGGAALADFDTLIELIQSTIDPESWLEAGGEGDIREFPSGCYVDAGGVLRRLSSASQPEDASLARLRRGARSGQSADLRRNSPLRKVSLVRLERELQALAAQGQPPTDAMRRLAGIQRVQYVFIYPEDKDIVLAGPAGDWRLDEEGRAVSVEGNQPILNLDDLVVMLRLVRNAGEGVFGCSINPRQANLARAQAYQREQADQPVDQQWLEGLRQALGRQDVEVFGIDPRTRAARVLVEADYRMKMIGMGLEEGVLGVRSYLQEALHAPDASDSSVVRWWFTLNYDAVRTTQDRAAFAIQGQGVQVLSENEALTAMGRRVHTGKSDRLTAGFANSFTEHFAALAQKYPLYADLRNIFDLALVARLLQNQDAFDQVDWHMPYLGAADGYSVELAEPAREVDTIANLKSGKRRDENGRTVYTKVVGVSGGVRADVSPLADDEALEVDQYGKLRAEHRQASPATRKLRGEQWWWD